MPTKKFRVHVLMSIVVEAPDAGRAKDIANSEMFKVAQNEEGTQAHTKGRFRLGCGGEGGAPMNSPAHELPELCVAVLQPEDVLIGIRRDQRGYYQMYDGMITGDAARTLADRLNKALDVTPRQREAMLIGSMMGWDCPAAQPTCDIHESARDYCPTD